MVLEVVEEWCFFDSPDFAEVFPELCFWERFLKGDFESADYCSVGFCGVDDDVCGVGGEWALAEFDFFGAVEDGSGVLRVY